MKMLQLSKQGQAPGTVTKNNLVAAVIGTGHEEFDGDWVWIRVCELWPEEITSSARSQQESIFYKWTTYTNVN